MVAGLYTGNALADGFDNAGALVAKDDGEGALGVFAGEGVGIYEARNVSVWFSLRNMRERPVGLTCVADTGVVDLDADLVGLGRGDLDILDGQLLTGLPGDGGLASDGL